MDPQREPVHTVVHFGSDAELVCGAAAESTTIAGDDRVLSVDGGVAELHSDRPTGARLIVCELPAESSVAPLAEVVETFPGVPTLAVVSADSVVDEALAAGATDVLVRRDDVDQTTLLARRMDTVAASVDPALVSESTEQILDAIDDSFYTLDTDGSLRRWNERFREVAGYDDAELDGMSALEFFSDADGDRVADAIESVFETGSATVEAELVSKDGTTTPVEYTGALVTGPDGTPQGVVGIGRDLTDRREREDRLVRLRQAVETIADSAPLTLFEVEADGTVSTVRGETLSKRLPGQITRGESVTDVFADHPRMRRHVETALDGEPSHDLVEIGDATLETWVQPALDGTGSVERVTGLALDVTEREARAGMLDQIQANAGEVIWLSSPEKTSMDFITDSYEDVWGRRPETLTENPTSFVEAIHPDDRDRVEAALAKQSDEPDAYEETYRVVRPDGEVRWVHDQSAGVYEDGELSRIIGIATDITAQKRREQELQLKNRAIETAPVGIAIHETTAAGSPITYVNDAFETTTGYDGDAVAGEGVSILGGADTDAERLQDIAAAVEAGDHCSETAVLHRADGTPYWGRVDVAPVMGANGEVEHAVSFVQDVTETKEHEQEIERHLTEFGEVLAEDLGTPLRDAKEQLEAATDDDGSDAALRRAEQSVETAISLVDDLATVHSFSVEPRRLSESMRGSDTVPTSRDE
jgi:PAS domain S-box-containing protein